VSVPASHDDTCPLAHYVDYSYLTPDAPAARLLDLQATVDQLPLAFVNRLVGAIQGYLDALASALPSGALAVGDHFLDHTGQVTHTASALRIEAQFHLDASVTEYNGVSCVTVCSAPGLFDTSSANQWAILAPVALTWRYATPAGQVVTSAGPALPPGAVPYDVILLYIGWRDGEWQTPTAVLGASETDPVICPTGAHLLSVTQDLIAAPQYQWPIAASTAELGCLFAGSDMDPTTGNPTGPMALVLYRAGALIAVNAQAHQLFPNLPTASAHERALAVAVAPASLP
jgi:hypothetical protein